MGHQLRLVPALLTVLVVSSLVLSGCGDSLTGIEAIEVDDEETLREFVEDHGFFDERGIYDAEGMEASDSGSREAIDPLTFWREVTERHVVRDVLINHEEGTAEVEVFKEIWGTLNIIDENMVEYVKPMHHQGTRYATFARVDDVAPPDGQGNGNGDGNGENARRRYRRGRWVLTGVSGLVVESEVLSMNIDWIRVQSAGVDTTITDPSLLMDVPEDIMHFEVGDEVTVTVSGPPEGSMLFLHTRGHKSPFQYDGGTFTGSWTVNHRGVHCAGVQALAHDSIFDSEYPDDCLIWAMPYAVGPEGEDEE